MKRFILSIMAMVLTMGAFAQTSKWLGYYDGESARYILGTETAETYDLAARYNGYYSGKTINAVRFYLRSTTGISDLKLWVSKTLPSSADAADVLCMDLDITTMNGGDESDSNYGMANDVELTTPVTIGDEGVYVGYSFTITEKASIFKQMSDASKYPIVRTGETSCGQSFMFKTSSSMTTWEEDGLVYGDLALLINVDGTFYNSAVVPSDFDARYVELNGSETFEVPFQNYGFDTVNSISYKAEANGTSYNGTVNLTTPLTKLLQEGSFEFSVPADTKESTQDVKLTITGVNGKANEIADATATGQLVTMNKVPLHRVAIEEFTGTGCGWCPRGWQGMENLREVYGDLFVGVALHQYNDDDAMYISEKSYKELGFTGAPSCMLNRSADIDPYYGSGTTDNGILKDFRNAMKTLAPLDVTVTGIWDATKSSINAYPDVKIYQEGAYDIEYVVIADDLHNPTNGGTRLKPIVWNQSNYYTMYDSTSLPADLQKFGSDGEYGVSEISDLHFNDVAICSSVSNNENQAGTLGWLHAGNEISTKWNIPFSVNDNVKAVLDYDKVYIIALVLDQEGKVVNAAKAHVVSEDAAAISNVTESKDVIPVSFYSVDGKQMSTPRNGMNIIRYSDNSVRKVIVK